MYLTDQFLNHFKLCKEQSLAQMHQHVDSFVNRFFDRAFQNLESASKDAKVQPEKYIEELNKTILENILVVETNVNAQFFDSCDQVPENGCNVSSNLDFDISVPFEIVDPNDAEEEDDDEVQFIVNKAPVKRRRVEHHDYNNRYCNSEVENDKR